MKLNKTTMACLSILFVIMLTSCAMVIIDSNKDNNCRKGTQTSITGSDDNICTISDPQKKEDRTD